MNSPALDRQGYLLWHSAVPTDFVARLHTAFHARVLAHNDWLIPRSSEWCRSLLDLDLDVQRVCRSPALIDGARHILKKPIFLAQVEGREPVPGNVPQLLHRDGAGFPGRYVAAMIWLNPFDSKVLLGATTNWSGARRRALQIFYAATKLRDQHKETEALRNVCSDTSETFV